MTGAPAWHREVFGCPACWQGVFEFALGGVCKVFLMVLCVTGTPRGVPKRASIMRAIKCHKGVRWMPWR